jgi:hypothetical protein
MSFRERKKTIIEQHGLRKEVIEKWFELYHKNDRIIDDITQHDESPVTGEQATKEDGGDDRSS